MLLFTNCTIEYLFVKQCQLGMGQYRFFRHRHDIANLPDLPDKASPGETGSASRVTQTEIVYKVTHLYNVFPIAA